MADSGKTGSQEFGDLLRLARERRGISRRELAEATNLSYPYISQLETGYRQPSPGAIRNLADVLELSLDEIFAAIGQRADEQASQELSPTAAGWIANKTYRAATAHAVQPVRLGGGGRPPRSVPSPVQSPAKAVAPARAEVMARAAAPMPAAPMPATPMLAAPSVAARAESALIPGSARVPTPLVAAVVDQALDLLAALPPSDQLAAVSQIQQKVIDAVIDERVQLRERH